MANLNHVELVQELRKIRIAQGLTGIQLAKKVFPSEKSISAMENGQKQLYLSDYVILCGVLKINPCRMLNRFMSQKYLKSSSLKSSSVRGRPKQTKVRYAQDCTNQPQDVGDKP